MRRWAALAAMAVVVLLGRLRLATAPLPGDVCCHALIGHEMVARGRPLYADLWERKPPLAYLTFAAAERVAGYDPAEVTLAGLVATWATLAAVYAVGRANGGVPAGLVAAGLWTAVWADLDLRGNHVFPEVFINACVTAAVAVLLAPPTRLRSLLAGGLLTAATFYKHNVALAAAGLLVGHGLATRRWSPAAVAGSVIAATWAAFLGRAYAVGRGPATVDVLFRQNFAYAGGIGSNLLSGLAPGRLCPPFAVVLVGPLLLVIAFAVLPRARRRPGPAWTLWLAWAVGTWATVATPGKLYPQYYQLWLPIACVGGGWATAGLGRSQVGRTVAAAVLIAVVVRQGRQFLRTPAEWVHDQFDYSVAHQNQMAAWIAAHVPADQTFWELGDDNALYFLAKRDPPSGLLFLDPLLYGTDPPAAWRRLLADLYRRPPPVVIFSTDWQMFFADHPTPLDPWLGQHYTFWRTVRFADGPDRPTTYTLFVRRGPIADQYRYGSAKSE